MISIICMYKGAPLLQGALKPVQAMVYLGRLTAIDACGPCPCTSDARDRFLGIVPNAADFVLVAAITGLSERQHGHARKTKSRK